MKDSIYQWLHALMTPCIKYSIYQGLHVSKTPCIKDSMYKWLHISKTTCINDLSRTNSVFKLSRNMTRQYAQKQLLNVHMGVNFKNLNADRCVYVLIKRKQGRYQWFDNWIKPMPIPFLQYILEFITPYYRLHYILISVFIPPI